MDIDEFDDLVNKMISGERAEKPPEQIYSVSDFIEVSNQTFEQNFPNVLIEGEISSFKTNQNKFIFFDLKDQGSSLGCFMTVWQMRFPLSDGMKVVVRAQPKLTKWGKFSLTVQQIMPKGEGSLKKSFDILKNKLEKEGLFSADKKRPLPARPQDIAIISSTQAAGYADFIKIINERWGGMKVRVAHTQVQGLVAADQMVRALNHFNQLPDLPEVIVIIRGGGSADDLASFNDEKLVRAIAASRVPILTGIGHETDESLADLAADLAASTPSNAAQFITPDKHAEINLIDSKISRLSTKVVQCLDQIKIELGLKMEAIGQGLIKQINTKLENIDSKIRLLGAYNPEKVLELGYAIIRGDLRVGSELEIETKQTILKAEVKDVRQK